MSDEQITVEQVVAEAVAPFVETVADAAEAATAVLEALREAGWENHCDVVFMEATMRESSDG